jgi:hypothetical protein
MWYTLAKDEACNLFIFLIVVAIIKTKKEKGKKYTLNRQQNRA